MNPTPPAPGLPTTVGNPVLNAVVFGAALLVLLVAMLRIARRRPSTSSYYTGGEIFTGPTNGMALAGDFLSAAAFLGIIGAIAVSGPDGFAYAAASTVAWLIVLFLVAELVRNTGRFTLADVLAGRLRARPVRAAAAVSVVVISTMYLVAQLAGAGGLVALLLDVHDRTGQSLLVAAVGLLMIIYVLIGGMTGATWLQVTKTILLIVVTTVLGAYVLGKFGLSVPRMLDGAAERHPFGQAVLRPGILYPGNDTTAHLDLLSMALGGLLGVAGLPHILMRFYTVPNARAARSSVTWAIWVIGGFYLLTLVLGYGATALVGPQRIMVAPGGVNSAAPLLALEVGGEVTLALVAAVAFTTILAVVAGLAITAAAAFAHDVYASVLRRGRAGTDEEVTVARWAAVVIGLLGIGGGILANGQNIAFVVSLTFTAAASATLPTLLYSLFWSRFTTTGALWSMYGGLVVTLVLIVLSPAVSGNPRAMLPDLDFDVFPLSNPGLVSIPAGFLLGVLGSLLGRERADPVAFARMSVRALTGAGLERAVPRDPSLLRPAGRHRRDRPVDPSSVPDGRDDGPPTDRVSDGPIGVDPPQGAAARGNGARPVPYPRSRPGSAAAHERAHTHPIPGPVRGSGGA